MLKTRIGTCNIDSLHYRTFGNSRGGGKKRERAKNMPTEDVNLFSPTVKRESLIFNRLDLFVEGLDRFSLHSNRPLLGLPVNLRDHELHTITSTCVV